MPVFGEVGVAYRRFPVHEPYNWRGAPTHALVTTVWYPAIAGTKEEAQWIGDPPLFSTGRAVTDAKLAFSPRRFPLILLSHGTGGSAAMMGWIGTALAAQGYIAAAVNHPGNNATEPYTAQGFTLWWERATDLSAVIDNMLADPMFGKRIDPQRIGAAGFSLGGYTMIEIAGGITVPGAYRDFCKSAKADGICKAPAEFPDLINQQERVAELAKSDSQVRESLAKASASRRDPRVRAVFAMAPAIGPAFPAEGLAKISIPVAIAAGDADENVPIESSARYFAAHIPHSSLKILDGGVGHYVFLGTCTPAGAQARPMLCADGPGVDRAAIHQKTIQMALEFFKANL